MQQKRHTCKKEHKKPEGNPGEPASKCLWGPGEVTCPRLHTKYGAPVEAERPYMEFPTVTSLP